MVKVPKKHSNQAYHLNLTHIRRLFRHFPYTELMATFIPVFAYGIYAGKITSLNAIFGMLPFVFADATGFVYNDIVDTKDPAQKKNPIQSGAISQKQAIIVLLGCAVLTLTTFFVFYHTFSAIIIFLIYYWLCFAYSGIKVRFKEQLIGPFVAAFIIWIGGPLVLATEIDILVPPVIAYLFGGWFVYVGREIYHTWLDYEDDLRSGYRTFSVRLSLSQQMIIKAGCTLAGVLLLAYSFLKVSNRVTPNGVGLVAIGTLILGLIAEIYFCLGSPFKNYPAIPYLLFRLFFVILAGFFLNISPLVTLLLAWVFVTSKRS